MKKVGRYLLLLVLATAPWAAQPTQMGYVTEVHERQQVDSRPTTARDEESNLSAPGFRPRVPGKPNARNIRSITIKWKRTTNIAQAQPPTEGELQRLSQAAGLVLTAFTDHGYGRIVFQLPQAISRTQAEALAAKIRALPEVQYASPNHPVRVGTVANHLLR
jgi:hypothetical protein